MSVKQTIEFGVRASVLISLIGAGPIANAQETKGNTPTSNPGRFSASYPTPTTGARQVPSAPNQENRTDATSDAARKELALLQGGWQFNLGGSSGHSADEISAILHGGKEYEALNMSDRTDFFAEWRLTVNGNEFQFGNGAPTGQTIAVLDPTKNPKWINFTDTKGRTWAGVYRLEGEMLFITVGYSNRPRMVFDAYSYSGHQLERGEAYACFVRPDGNPIPKAVSEKKKKEQDAAQNAYQNSLNSQVNAQSYAPVPDSQLLARRNLSDAWRALRAYRNAIRNSTGQQSPAPQQLATSAASQQSIAYYPPSMRAFPMATRQPAGQEWPTSEIVTDASFSQQQRPQGLSHDPQPGVIYFPPSLASEGRFTPNGDKSVDYTGDAGAQELALVQGRWRFVTAASASCSMGTYEFLLGQKDFFKGSAEPNWDGYRLIVKGREFQFGDGTPTGRTTATIDPTKHPKWIDFKDPMGQTWFGVYRLEGDKLTISVGYGNRRPRKIVDNSDPYSSLYLKPGEAYVIFARITNDGKDETEMGNLEKYKEQTSRLANSFSNPVASSNDRARSARSASVPVEPPAEEFFSWNEGVNYSHMFQDDDSHIYDENTNNYWAAIAYSPETGRWGTATRLLGRDTAMRMSRDNCQAADARPVVLVGNGWCALATGKDPTVWGVGWAKDRSSAEQYALDAARKQTTECQIAVSLFARN